VVNKSQILIFRSGDFGADQLSFVYTDSAGALKLQL